MQKLCVAVRLFVGLSPLSFLALWFAVPLPLATQTKTQDSSVLQMEGTGCIKNKAIQIPLLYCIVRIVLCFCKRICSIALGVTN